MKAFFIGCFLISSYVSILSGVFAPTDASLLAYRDDPNVLIIASPGRSGSSLLTDIVKSQALNYKIVKTHKLPLSNFKGKILFIFSNPDLSAESALHCILHNGGNWGNRHFDHVFSSDKEWLSHIEGDATKQTIAYNLLAQDALGVGFHLEEWLFNRVEPATLENAGILAIKYENLWDLETSHAIMKFLSLSSFVLPEKKQRGYTVDLLFDQELMMRETYNKGTLEDPRYVAYDFARTLWENAPPFQFLKVKDVD